MTPAQAAQAPPGERARQAPPEPPLAARLPEAGSAQAPEAPQAAGVVGAAVAEALHVGGRFDDAARAWARLAGAGHDVASSSLKAAMSYLAAGDEASGLAWLERASAGGAEPADVLYVTAQHALSRGRAAEAEEALRQACRVAPAGPALTALGVLRWRDGARAEARRLFREALERDPRDALARVDLVSAELRERAGAGRHAAAMLAEAVAASPHRAEPFVLYSRLGLVEPERREALARARLRTRQLQPWTPRRAPGERLGDALVSVRRGRRGDALDVTARFTCDAHGPGHRPETVLLNAGYHTVTIAGRPAARAPGQPGQRGVRYAIPATCWATGGGRALLEVRAQGSPRPPFARVSQGWMELGEGSAWVPVPGPGWRWRMRPRIDLGADVTAVVSEPGPTGEGFALIALSGAGEVTVAGAAAGGRAPVSALGRVERPLLQRAAEVAGCAATRWQELLGRPTPAAAVVVLERGDSTFCYHRPGLTRITSAVAAGEAQHALIHHEVGHHWWGGAVAVAPGDRWLAEGLAEYGLHLAEEAGDVRGYLAATLAALRRLGGGRLPADGLARLAATPGGEAAYVLRAKAAHVMRMLRAVIGEQAFRATLRACTGHPGELDGYTFFALASYFHGHAVDWFANQWVHTDAAMRLQVADVTLRRRRRGWDVTFVARCDGYAVPGASVEFLVRGEEGSALASANVDLMGATVSLRMPARPRSITVDPALRWYADVPERVVNLEP